MKLRLYILFSIIALFVLGPLMLPGYVLTLDMVFGPHFIANYTDGQVFATLPVFSVIGWVSAIVPNWIIQKVILFVILALSGIGGASLLKGKSENAQIIAGIAYMLNPFVYTRFLAGHWLFLFGYALLPFWIVSLRRFFVKNYTGNNSGKNITYENHKTDKNAIAGTKIFWKSLIEITLLTNIIILISFHTIWLMLIIGAVTLLVRRKTLSWKLVKKLFLIIVVTILIQSFWLIPLLWNTVLASLSASTQLSFFAVRGLLLEKLTGYGFWGQYEGFGNQFVWLSDTPILFVSGLIVIAGLFGAMRAFKQKDQLSAIIIISGILSFGLMLISTTSFGVWLYDNVPGLMMMRDSHKFSALWMMLIAVGLAYFWEICVDFASEKFHSKNAELVLFTGLIMLLAIQSYTMFNGFNGQLKSISYPDSWYQVAEIIDNPTVQNGTSDNANAPTMLILPWHQYMSLSFNNDLLTLNPVFRFFTTPLIYSTSPKYDGINIILPSAEEQKYSKITEDYVIEKNELSNIDYVMLLKEVDYDQYEIDLPIALETDDLILYEK